MRFRELSLHAWMEPSPLRRSRLNLCALSAIAQTARDADHRLVRLRRTSGSRWRGLQSRPAMEAFGGPAGNPCAPAPKIISKHISHQEPVTQRRLPVGMWLRDQRRRPRGKVQTGRSAPDLKADIVLQTRVRSLPHLLQLRAGHGVLIISRRRNTDRPQVRQAIRKLPMAPHRNHPTISGARTRNILSDGHPNAVRVIGTPHMITGMARSIVVMNRAPLLCGLRLCT